MSDPVIPKRYITYAEKGAQRVNFDRKDMPVLNAIAEDWLKNKPFKGLKIAVCLHITTETAVLVEAIASGGAQVLLIPSNPLSTQDDVVAYLNCNGEKLDNILCKGRRGEVTSNFSKYFQQVADFAPDFLIDDGADVVSFLHRTGQIKQLKGACEETTTGVNRLRAMYEQNKLMIPVFAVNDSRIKHLFDNKYGTGQSTIDGIIRATNRMIAGSTFVIIGYGPCGYGIAKTVKGYGAHTVVVEVDPVRALQASLDGHSVCTMETASEIGDFFVTVTGNKNVIELCHIESMKDGAIVCNSGHFDVEIDVKGMDESYGKEQLDNGMTRYNVYDKSIFLLGEGRLVNLSCATGHPSCVLDLSFSGQALALQELVEGASETEKLASGIHSLSPENEDWIARTKLNAMGIEIGELTQEQIEYMNSWTEGTEE